MSKPKILLQLDTDDQPSVFDSVVALDAGVDQLLRHSGISPANVRDRVHGIMFTRGPGDLHHSAIFIGGSDVALGDEVLTAVTGTFFGPLRSSVMIDSGGANTTAAAAALAAAEHLDLSGAKALVLAATGPVGRRAVRLLARQGAEVVAASRSLERAREVCQSVQARVPEAKLTPIATSSAREIEAALAEVQLVIAAGAAGVELLSAQSRAKADSLRVAIDLNAVPPAGIAGIEVTDKAREREGVICYGAIGVGGRKMKIHRAAIQALFEKNDRVLDAEEILEIGRGA